MASINRIINSSTNSYVSPYKYPRGAIDYSTGEYGIKVLDKERDEELYRLAILYIPKNTLCFRPFYSTKRRASEAIVLKVVAIIPDETDRYILKISEVEYGRPFFGAAYCNGGIVWGDNGFVEYKAPDFKYIPNETVKPLVKFSARLSDCESGIHYFGRVTELFEYLNPVKAVFGLWRDQSKYEEFRYKTLGELDGAYASYHSQIENYYRRVIDDDIKTRENE